MFRNVLREMFLTNNVNKMVGTQRSSVISFVHNSIMLDPVVRKCQSDGTAASTMKPKRASQSVTQTEARGVVNLMKKNCMKDDLILDMVSGDGFLVQEILNHMPNKIISYDRNLRFGRNVPDASEHERLILSKLKLKLFYTYLLQKKKCDTMNKDALLLQEISDQCAENSGVVIVAVLRNIKTSQKFIQHICNSFSQEWGIYEKLKPVWYFVLNKNCYNVLANMDFPKSSRRAFQVLALYFEFQPLGKLQSSYPDIKEVYSKPSYVLRVSPRSDVKEKLGDVRLFDFFVNKLFRVQTNTTTIQYLEEFIPEFGITCIENGFQAISHPSMMSPEELVKLFKLFISYPSYPSCYFAKLYEYHDGEFGRVSKDDDSEELSDVSLDEDDATLDEDQAEVETEEAKF